ncbi:MEDS domain-containing protein [Actinomadura kijaniata]|uniref:MEDS domain-containing protein n=1 Tax=Actinomadura kijaniata TaxID=46161 RepID=UPI003F1DA001
MFTDSLDDYLDFVVAYAGNGLASGHQVTILVEMIAPTAMTAWLRSRLPDAAAAFERGALQVQAARDTYLRGGGFDPARVMADFDATTRQAQAAGYPGVWASADMAWALLDSDLIADVMDFEAKCNQVLLERRLAAVCHYERRMFDAATLHRVRAVHPFSQDGVGLRFTRTTNPPGICFTGHADATNRQAFSAVLATQKHVPGPVTLDITALHLPDPDVTGEVIELAAARTDATIIVATSTMADHLRILVKTHPALHRVPVVIHSRD